MLFGFHTFIILSSLLIYVVWLSYFHNKVQVAILCCLAFIIRSRLLLYVVWLSYFHVMVQVAILCCLAFILLWYGPGFYYMLFGFHGKVHVAIIRCLAFMVRSRLLFYFLSVFYTFQILLDSQSMVLWLLPLSSSRMSSRCRVWNPGTCLECWMYCTIFFSLSIAFSRSTEIQKRHVLNQ